MSSSTDLLHSNVSKVFQHLGGFDWNNVPIADYKPSDDSWRGVTRRSFVGERGESPLFHLRYFEIEKGGYTTLEQHQHEHVVVCMRGRGQAVLGCRTIEMGFGDVVYVAPNDAHQFRNDDRDEPFGFFCIVNAERDRPREAEANFCPICD
ncbi:MAG: cupin domain-containing protein [Vulcanimicrobiota bacterium]